jgi:hypothetical protein
MNISKSISNEPITGFKRLVHYSGLEDYPAVFQPMNVPNIIVKFIVEYFTESDHLIKRMAFVFKIDATTLVNPQTGALDPNGIPEIVFFNAILSGGIILPQLIDSYIDQLDARGDFDEDNWFKRETRPYPFV